MLVSMSELRDKVINGLECVICPNAFCGNCIYFVRNENDPDTGWCDRDAIYKNALELLKAQEPREPRVMTLEESEKSEIGFIEWRDEYITAALIIDVYDDDTVGVVTPDEDGEYWIDTNEYGKTWRCWTSRPTDEQRKAVPWE